MSITPRMTLDDVAKDMRSYGMSIDKNVLSHCLREGVFPFARIVSIGETGRVTFIIMRKDYEDWAKEYLLPYANT